MTRNKKVKFRVNLSLMFQPGLIFKPFSHTDLQDGHREHLLPPAAVEVVCQTRIPRRRSRWQTERSAEEKPSRTQSPVISSSPSRRRRQTPFLLSQRGESVQPAVSSFGPLQEVLFFCLIVCFELRSDRFQKWTQCLSSRRRWTNTGWMTSSGRQR